MSRTTFVVHVTADTSPVDPSDPVLQQEIGDTIAAAMCDQIDFDDGWWPNTGSITADVVEVLDTAPPDGPPLFDRDTADRQDAWQAAHDGAEAPLDTEPWQPEPGDLVELTRRNGEAPAGTRAHVKATGTDMAICTMTIRVDHAIHFEDLKAVPR